MNMVDDDGALPVGTFIGRESFRTRVREGLAAAGRAGWRELILCDASFEDWPLGERAVVDALEAWARGGQRLTLLARRYDELERRHPLFVHWRRQRAHLIECRGVPTADALAMPSVLWSPAWALQRHEVLRSSGVCGDEAARLLRLRELLDGWLERSSPAFAATTLGL